MTTAEPTVIYESGQGRATVLSRHGSYDEAWAALSAKPGLAFVEADEENEGCADAVMADGRLLCIEPAARRGL